MFRLPIIITSARNYSCVQNFFCKDVSQTILDPFGKVAIVTGGGTGIGYAAACELLNNGAKKVIVAQKNERIGLEAAEMLCNHFGMDKASYLPCDVNCSKQYEDVFRCCLEQDKRIDIIFNNAGVMDDKDWEQAVDTNIIGLTRGNLLALKYMNKTGGVVINNSATAGLSPWPNCPVFAATKHAVISLTRCLGDDFHLKRTGIRFVALCPGWTNTNLWEEGLHRHIKDEWAEDTMRCISNRRLQMAEYVGKAVVHLVKYAKSGSVYVSEDGMLHRAVYPELHEILKQEPISK